MGEVPTGLVSFLYNVMNNIEFNEKFRKSEQDRERLMDFFQLSPKVKDVVRQISQNELKREKARAKRKANNRKAADQEYGEREVINEKQLEVVFAALGPELQENYRRTW